MSVAVAAVSPRLFGIYRHSTIHTVYTYDTYIMGQFFCIPKDQDQDQDQGAIIHMYVWLGLPYQSIRKVNRK